ncbi:hypothetical protein [Corynebacterium comes]|uniref:hypothetical protein n=1 Tax=Corynebacterium comes TaxID=2675218 RepID=UPI0012E1980C|nr:hypothetical protein [Corynebacterium comes]
MTCPGRPDGDSVRMSFRADVHRRHRNARPWRRLGLAALRRCPARPAASSLLRDGGLCAVAHPQIFPPRHLPSTPWVRPRRPDYS